MSVAKSTRLLEKLAENKEREQDVLDKEFLCSLIPSANGLDCIKDSDINAEYKSVLQSRDLRIKRIPNSFPGEEKGVVNWFANLINVIGKDKIYYVSIKLPSQIQSVWLELDWEGFTEAVSKLVDSGVTIKMLCKSSSNDTILIQSTEDFVEFRYQ